MPVVGFDIISSEPSTYCLSLFSRRLPPPPLFFDLSSLCHFLSAVFFLAFRRWTPYVAFPLFSSDLTALHDCFMQIPVL